MPGCFYHLYLLCFIHINKRTCMTWQGWMILDEQYIITHFLSFPGVWPVAAGYTMNAVLVMVTVLLPTLSLGQDTALQRRWGQQVIHRLPFTPEENTRAKAYKDKHCHRHFVIQVFVHRDLIAYHPTRMLTPGTPGPRGGPCWCWGPGPPGPAWRCPSGCSPGTSWTGGGGSSWSGHSQPSSKYDTVFVERLWCV